MNCFTKIDGDWCAKIDNGSARTGETVTLQTRAGQRKQVVLGEFVTADCWGQIFKIAPRAEQTTQTVGDLSGIVALFDRAKQHLKFPAITLDGFRVNVAGQRARQPGSLTITSLDKGADGRRGWFGRVTIAGVFEPARDADPAIGAKLRAFAADPAGQAAEYGRLHGICCFCNKPLRDERSTAVGYGPVCADHFGLEWGSRAAAPLAQAARDAQGARDALAYSAGQV